MVPGHEPPRIASDNLEPVLRLARRTLRFWPAAMLVLVLGVAATVAVVKMRPRQYRSEAVLHYREGMQWNPNEGYSARRMGQRLKETLLARTQLAKIIEELGLYPKLVSAGRTSEAVNAMLLATSFKLGDGEIFVISHTADTPEEAQRVTARLTAVLIDENTTFRSSQAVVTREFLEAERKRNEADLAAKEAEHFRFLAKHPEFLQEQGSSGGALRARAKPADDGTAIAALRREELRLRSQLASPGRAPVDPAVGARDAEAKLKAAQQNLATLRASYTDEHPDVRSAAARVQAAETAYRRASAALEASGTAGASPDLQAQLTLVQQEIASALQRSSPPDARDPLAASSDSATRVVALETEWTRLNREVAEARERLAQLDSKQFTASMTLSTLMSGQAGRIVVIDPAFLPAGPVGMSDTRLFLMGLALTLLLSVGLATALSLLDDRIRDRVDVERLGLAPLLVEVSETASGGGKPGAGAERARVGVVSSSEQTAGTPGSGAPVEVGDAQPGSYPVPHGPLSLVASIVAAPAPATAGNSFSRPERATSALALRAPPRGQLAMRDPAVFREPTPKEESSAMLRVHRVALVHGSDARLLMLDAPDSPAAASYRRLRHRLAEGGEPMAILVTSPGDGEGKTSCALNLSLALGESGRARVLLLEANLRRPSLARLLGFEPPMCISKQLAFFRAMRVHSWDVAETVTPWLHAAAVAPEGEKGPILDGPALSVCIEDMRGVGYDHIVIDSSSVLGSADVNLVQETVDGVLLVVRCEKTRARDLRKAVEQIGTAKLLGIVLLGS